ncbi:MAG: cob(I)yrinic acid a,c-diamide adenosyltransferase, partial [Planctomycetes bacterium]|nr:cob(I)yrinic acid a,c-diamide adenosyltransferase [Planctomycetota bacterium]
ELFTETRRAAPDSDCLILDEICGVTARDMIPESEVVDFLASLRGGQTAVLTGRGAGPGLIAAADTVSEILCLKHCFREGIEARKGVEM